MLFYDYKNDLKLVFLLLKARLMALILDNTLSFFFCLINILYFEHTLTDLLILALFFDDRKCFLGKNGISHILFEKNQSTFKQLHILNQNSIF